MVRTWPSLPTCKAPPPLPIVKQNCFRVAASNAPLLNMADASQGHRSAKTDDMSLGSLSNTAAA